MSEKFKSRKFWVMMGSVVALVVAELTGYTIDPQAIAGLGAIVVVWLGGQSYIDKGKVISETKVAGEIGKVQAIAYARQLEQQLAALGAQDKADELASEGIDGLS